MILFLILFRIHFFIHAVPQLSCSGSIQLLIQSNNRLLSRIQSIIRLESGWNPENQNWEREETFSDISVDQKKTNLDSLWKGNQFGNSVSNWERKQFSKKLKEGSVSFIRQCLFDMQRDVDELAIVAADIELRVHEKNIQLDSVIVSGKETDREKIHALLETNHIISKENQDLMERIKMFQASFQHKMQVIMHSLESLESNGYVEVVRESTSAPIASQTPPLELKDDSLQKDTLLAAQSDLNAKLEKRIVLLTKQLESESALREKQTIIIDQYKQRLKQMKEQAAPHKREIFPSTASK